MPRHTVSITFTADPGPSAPTPPGPLPTGGPAIPGSSTDEVVLHCRVMDKFRGRKGKDQYIMDAAVEIIYPADTSDPQRNLNESTNERGIVNFMIKPGGYRVQASHAVKSDDGTSSYPDYLDSEVHKLEVKKSQSAIGTDLVIYLSKIPVAYLGAMHRKVHEANVIAGKPFYIPCYIENQSGEDFVAEGVHIKHLYDDGKKEETELLNFIKDKGDPSKNELETYESIQVKNGTTPHGIIKVTPRVSDDDYSIEVVNIEDDT